MQKKTELDPRQIEELQQQNPIVNEQILTQFLNVFHCSNFRIIFSNIPSYNGKKVNMQMYENFYRTITFPGLTNKTIDTAYGMVVRKEPFDQYNKNFAPFTIEFFVNENFANYCKMFLWMLQQHLGQGGHDMTGKEIDQMHDSVIELISILILDNNNRQIARVNYKRCIITELSSLTLDPTQKEPAKFTVTFQPNDLEFLEDAVSP